MSEPTSPTESGRRRRRRRPRRKRRNGIHLLPQIFTTGNLFFGFFAIVHASLGNFDRAALGIVLAVGFDILDGRVACFCDEDEKARRAAGFAGRLGIAFADCLAVGDSRSDLPLFKLTGRAIALNARPDAKAWASEHLETKDLRAILPMLGI